MNKKYSIIVPYRNREEHLSKLLPRLHEVFSGKDYEVIVVEQDDNTKFKLAQLFNVGALYAKGSKLIFHDVDHYPSDDVSYEIENNPVYPVKRVMFLDEDGQRLRPQYDIPAGYRKFSTSANGHWGGVFILTREMFEKIRGFNPLYNGWGKEDEDRHHRLLRVGYNPIRRQQGTFYGLYHEDNCPPPTDDDFIRNHQILNEMDKYAHVGYMNQEQDVDEFDAGENVRWLKVTNIRTVGV